MTSLEHVAGVILIERVPSEAPLGRRNGTALGVKIGAYHDSAILLAQVVDFNKGARQPVKASFSVARPFPNDRLRSYHYYIGHKLHCAITRTGGFSNSIRHKRYRSGGVVQNIVSIVDLF